MIRPTSPRVVVFALAFLPATALAQTHNEKPADPAAPGTARLFEAPVASRTVIQRGPFRSVQVNINAQGNNIANDAANEPSISVDPADPTKIVIGWRQFDNISSNHRENGYSHSQDGGATWTSPGSIESSFNSDPVLDVDRFGTFYYLSYPSGTTLRVYRSTNFGQTWAGPFNTTGGDKPWMLVDRSNSIGQDNVYLIWQTAHGPRTFSRSTNGGTSFGRAIQIPQEPTFGTMAVDNNGDVYAAGLAFQNFGSFVIAKSTNAKNSSQTPSFQTRSVNMGGRMDISAGPNPGGLLGQAQVAPDPTRPGHVYMLCSVDPPGSDPMDVHFVRSTDGGATFGSPIKINQDRGNNWQWFGTLSVAPTGRIDVVWNDTRASGVSSRSETYYSYSLDAGTTWANDQPISPEWNSLVGWPNQNKIGDYYHMVSTPDAGHLAYSATFNNEQDTYYVELGDCNGNQVHDGVDLQNGTSFDANGNAIPDECELCQTDLGNGFGLDLSLCGDDLTRGESAATLDLKNGPPTSTVFLVLSVGQLNPPFALIGGGFLVPDPGAVPSFVFNGYTTDAQGRMATTWTGGSNSVARIYAQAAMISGTSLSLSNALEIDIGV